MPTLSPERVILGIVLAFTLFQTDPLSPPDLIKTNHQHLSPLAIYLSDRFSVFLLLA